MYLWLALVAVLGLALGVVIHLRHDASIVNSPPGIPRTVSDSTTRAIDTPAAGPPPIVAMAPAVVPDANSLAAVAQADLATAQRLADRLRANARLGETDLRAAEELYTRYPEPGRALLEAVLVRTAQQEHAARRDAMALALLRRALALSPQSVPALKLLLAINVDQGDWPATETAARDLLAASAGDADAACSLAHALVRLDRSREAIEVLTAFLQTREDPAAHALLERIRHDARTEASLGRQDLAHFHVRYDGDAHEDVGREVLRVLDRHYATLAQTFDHRPAEPVPVILMSRQTYLDETDAPAWSGGTYSGFDGRVRIPIGGLTTSLTPALDRVLLHELAHAFITEQSGGLAPGEIQEGLAQFVSGRRSASPSEEPLHALATGRLVGVPAFYLGSLAFVEELIAQRGQGGINDLLASMQRSRDVDAAFRQVYDKDYGTLLSEFSARLRQRYGS